MDFLNNCSYHLKCVCACICIIFGTLFNLSCSRQDFFGAEIAGLMTWWYCAFWFWVFVVHSVIIMVTTLGLNLKLLPRQFALNIRPLWIMLPRSHRLLFSSWLLQIHVLNERFQATYTFWLTWALSLIFLLPRSSSLGIKFLLGKKFCLIIEQSTAIKYFRF